MFGRLLAGRNIPTPTLPPSLSSTGPARDQRNISGNITTVGQRCQIRLMQGVDIVCLFVWKLSSMNNTSHSAKIRALKEGVSEVSEQKTIVYFVHVFN